MANFGGRRPMKNFGERLTETMQVLLTEKERKLVEARCKTLGISESRWLRGAVYSRLEVEKIKILKTPVKGE